MWLALWIAACSPPPPEPPAADPAAMEVVVAALEEIPAHYRSGQDDSALAAWEEAHAHFEARLEAGLRRHHGEVPTAELEYRFGLLRVELGEHSGDPDPRVEALVGSLERAAASLPTP